LTLLRPSLLLHSIWTEQGRTIMKRLLVALLAALCMTGGSMAVQAQGCGPQPPKPLLPLGCKDLAPLCVCGSHGSDCHWEWACVK
jgi:hypothetical protein